MRRIRRLGIAAATLAAALTMVIANPAHAAPDPTDVTTAASLQDEAEAFADAVAKLEPSVIRADDGTLQLRTTAVRAGVSQDAFNQVSASLRAVNQAVVRGELETTADLDVRPAGFGTMHTGVIYRWWGMEAHMTSTTTNWVMGLLAGGISLSLLAGLLTSPTVFGPIGATVAAAVLGLGIAALTVCNASGNGVKIHNPYVGPPWCTSH